jgi:hypothetical protein
MVRLMLHRPSVAMLDECTSAVDEHQQNVFYELLRAQGICFVSVGHRPELQRLHDKVQAPACHPCLVVIIDPRSSRSQVLRLDGRGSYTLALAARE